ncbi:DUF924 domain-containing protein [Duganella sp. FT3S]|uniref:DUF924 domain-containing protein n=1 Tax=Rugamonas fusca TaxID=2758568 RepID=A0A7W2EFJ0_9BURK|nr:DUF924 family protein [Rugamonas fusca]MBA5604902.1 DUF924 domain-containing protein [Rugamonas fusca]
MNAEAKAIFDFWFLPAGTPGAGAARAEWFRKDDAFDREIGHRFGPLIEQALAGGLHHWDAGGPQAALARILLLDQFTRNVFRGTPRAFAGDKLALQAAQDMVDDDEDLALTPLQRAFVYLPFEHAEDLDMQRQSVALFTRLAAASTGFQNMLDYAHRHRDVIERFGRFPHRNAILGRPSTPDELAFLQQPGSGF